MKREAVTVGPQPGPQTAFLECTADVAIYGGAAGGGKSHGLLLEAARNIRVKNYQGVIFRKTMAQIRKQGSLWDASNEVYPLLGGKPLSHVLKWTWPQYGSAVGFAHMEHEKDKLQYQGAAIPFIGFDELTHFSAGQFFYMLSRNRSMTGIPGYMRGGCNPDPDSFVAKLIEWYINQDTGFPVPARSGVVRWFVQYQDAMHWADTREELIARFGVNGSSNPNAPIPKSFTFIASNIYDNALLMAKDPGYLANLLALSTVDRERLLKGNWKIRASAGLVFKRQWFPILDRAPLGDFTLVRYWDRAASAPEEGEDPDWTVGVLGAMDRDGNIYILDVRREQLSPGGVEDLILRTAEQDGPFCEIWLEQDPGSSGVADVDHLSRVLNRWSVKINKVTKDKLTRAKPASSQSEHGHVALVRAAWNDAFLTELENFPDGGHDDQVDAFSGCVTALTGGAVPLQAHNFAVGSPDGHIIQGVGANASAVQEAIAEVTDGAVDMAELARRLTRPAFKPRTLRQ